MKMLFAFSLFVFSFMSFAQAKKSPYSTEVFITQSDVVWSFDFLNADSVIFTEKSGKLYTLDLKTKKATAITGAPKVYDAGQGGLLDVRVHPKNGFVYLSYSEPVGEDKSTTALGRGKLEGNKLVGFQKIFSALPASENDYHYGSRIVFMDDGYLFLSVGERGERPQVQKNETHLGKIIRMKEDGSEMSVWSKGLRNPQGLTKRPGTNELWEAEMGPKGGDEVNIIEKDKNYGWPEVTYGKEYYGLGIGVKKRADVTEPVAYWVPSISPSNLTFYDGDKMPEWKGNLFLGLLSGEHIRRLEISGNKVTKQEELFKDLGWRWRCVRTGPDGYLWFSTDEGKIGRVVKK